MIRACEMLILLIALLTGTPPRQELTISTPEGIQEFHYDSLVVNGADMGRWAQLSENIAPYNFYLVPESLQVCLSKAADYAQCGSRDLNDPNFMHNARVNISRIERRIAELKSGYYPEELKPVVEYFLRIQTTFLAEDAANLRYMESGDASDLVFVENGVDYGTECGSLIKKFRSTEDKSSLLDRIGHDWHNCVNQAFASRHGYDSYPKSSWEHFLKRYSIEERFVPKDLD